MSWIFTIVFSGLLFTSNNGTTTVPVAASPESDTNVVTVTRDETERTEQTYPLSANGRVSVSNVNGSIVAEAWDRNEVKLVTVKTADSKERLSEVEIRIDSKPDSFSVETSYDNWKQKNGERWRNGGKLNVDYQLMVPRGAVINEIETVNGSVTISNFTNATKISAVNGTVKASNLRGTADLSTVNGEVDADFTSLDPGSKISLSTVNGRVNLTIPSDSNATVKVDSLNGNITNDFGLPVHKGKYIGRDLYGRLAAGDVKIKIDSVNGDLRILRQNDGRALSPATNLLPQKEKDDDDWDIDIDKEFKSAKTEKEFKKEMSRVDRDVSRSVRESSKAVTVAMKEANKEMAAMITPEIANVAANAVKIAGDAMRAQEIQNAISDGLLKKNGAMAKLANAGFFPSVPRVEKKSQSFPMKGVPKVTVKALGCAVKITGWDKNEVQYAVTQFSDARDRAPISVNEKHDDSSLNLTVENKAANKNGGFFETVVRVRIEIFVPRKTDLNIKTDGEIRLDGVSGDIQLEGGDQSINVRDVDGKMRISNTDGRIRVVGFRGSLVGQTVDGSMNLEGDFQSLSATGDTGSITVTLSEGANAKILATSPDLIVDGLPVKVIRSDDGGGEYKLGSGAATIKVTTCGEVLFRNASMLVAGL